MHILRFILFGINLLYVAVLLYISAIAFMYRGPIGLELLWMIVLWFMVLSVTIYLGQHIYWTKNASISKEMQSSVLDLDIEQTITHEAQAISEKMNINDAWKTLSAIGATGQMLFGLFLAYTILPRNLDNRPISGLLAVFTVPSVFFLVGLFALIYTLSNKGK